MSIAVQGPTRVSVEIGGQEISFESGKLAKQADGAVVVRSGDTKPGERTAMSKKPPHILVTTPESLYILLTSEGGRRMLRTVKSVIVDEIHAIARDKRGSHLGLSLERLEALAGPVQRIGLSATQKPLDEVGRFLVGVGRECSLVDAGHIRQLDLEVVPGAVAVLGLLP